MIDTFTIKNYQIIKDGMIKIRPGITLITGPSNNGKSSIFKAYKQLIYNTSGNTYINSFADKCKLVLENELYKIEYTKEKTKSSYDIKDTTGTQHIDKLGVNQIDKVKELTQIDKDFGYNFWDQLEKPFLLCKTNREQFLLLQESPISSNLLNIQETIKTDIKTLKDEILVSQGSLDVINNSITKQESILENSNLVQEVSNKASDLNILNKKLNTIMDKVREFSTIEKELEKFKNFEELNLNTNIDAIFNRYNSVLKRVNELTTYHQDILNIDKEINTTDNEIVNIKEIIEKYFQICPLCGNMISENHNII